MATSAGGPSAPFGAVLRVAAGSAEDFEHWHSSVAPMFAMDAADSEERGHFLLEGASYQFAGLAVASVTSSATVFDRDARVIARGGIDSILVQTYLTGGYRLAVAGRETDVNAGDICLLDMTSPCVLRGTAYTHLSIVVARTEIEALAPDLDALHGLILPRGTPLNKLLLSHMRALYAEAPSLGNSEGQAAARATAGLISACAAPGLAEREVGRRTNASLAGVRLRRLIEANLGDPELGPEFLVRNGGVSRATLYRLFAPMGGVRAHIQQQRLARAFRMLSNPARRGERVGAIAARCGFADDTVFSQALRRAYGMSASDIRATAADHSTRPAAGEGSFREVNRWLLGLDAGVG